MLNKPIVLVIGSTDYLGSQIVSALLVRGIGFENLAKAVKHVRTRRMVLTGALKSPLALNVPLFRNKQPQEDLLETMNIPQSVYRFFRGILIKDK